MLAISAVAMVQVSMAQEADPAADPDVADFYIGLYGGFGTNHHTANIRPTDFDPRMDLPPSANLTGGTGNGALAGLMFELPFSRLLSIGLRAGYQERGGRLEQVYTNTNDVTTVEGGSTSAQVTDALDATMPYLSFTPHVKLTPSSLPLYVIAGPTVLYSLGGTYTYTETIAEPTDARFTDNNKRTRTVARGDLATKTIVPAITAGIGYDFLFSRDFGAFLELQYTPVLTDVVTNLASGGEWKTSSIALAAGLRFGITSEPEPVRVVAVAPTPPVTTTSRVMHASAVVDGQLAPELVIQGRQVKATEAYAFLPYVFFARDSAQIPDRYQRIDRRSMRDYNSNRIERGDALAVYYNVLNIIGERLRDNKKARITLSGCSSNAEHQDTALGARRAEAIRDYLINVWRVAKSRIDIEARGLPKNPTLSEVDSVEGDRENQRVEFAATDFAVLAPVQLIDTTLLAPAGTVRFFVPPFDSAHADSWVLSVSIGDSLIENAATGFGPPPSELDFVLKNRPDLRFAQPTPITGKLLVRDTLFNEVASFSSDTVIVRQTGEFEQEKHIVAGRNVDTYTLLLYSFDSDALLDFTQQAGVLMHSQVTPASTVRIIGHTDRIGLPPYNMKLSERRAEVASQNLGVPLQVKEIKGLGEKNLLYNNTLPEGRYYCRTVTVVIETPIPGQEVSTR